MGIAPGTRDEVHGPRENRSGPRSLGRGVVALQLPAHTRGEVKATPRPTAVIIRPPPRHAR
eukprot:gene42061-1832_t